METLVISLFTGALGAGYFMYGKRQAKLSAIFAGLVLCLAPFLVPGAVWLVVVSAAAAVLPFVVEV